MVSLHHLSPTALLSLGAMLLAGLGAQTAGKATALPMDCRCRHEDPREFFSLDSASLAPPFGTLSIAGSSALPVFTVPMDKKLIITDIGSVGGYVQLAEVQATGTTIKRGPWWVGTPQRDEYHSSTGLAFAPGSQVSWENVTADNVPYFYFHLSGYLLPD